MAAGAANDTPREVLEVEVFEEGKIKKIQMFSLLKKNSNGSSERFLIRQNETECGFLVVVLRTLAVNSVSDFVLVPSAQKKFSFDQYFLLLKNISFVPVGHSCWCPR